MSLRRAAVTAGLVLLALAGCADTEGATRASAECGSALHDELGLTENQTGPRTKTEVTGDDEGRHVEGTWTSGDGEQGAFTCDVVADDHSLRGWRVTDLDVERRDG